MREMRINEAKDRLLLNSSLKYRPKRVISMIGASRSGSTVMKYALCLHPELTSLAGEEEPYYKLAGNGYPWHNSDEFHEVNDPDYIRLLIANEVHGYSVRANRKVLQLCGVEEPPYVEPIETLRPPTDTLVLKTPQNCYRRGVIEQLYPEAEVVYIDTVRHPLATINGLIDGWNSGDFTARLTEVTFSHTQDVERRWWCFDMPPNWTWKVTLLERCVNQWYQARQFVQTDYKTVGLDTMVMNFETFQKDWREAVRQAWLLLSLSRFVPTAYNLPQMMTTDPPGKDRWRRKRPWLAEAVDLTDGTVRAEAEPLNDRDSGQDKARGVK